jgi:Ca2+:H+ antiporter
VRHAGLIRVVQLSLLGSVLSNLLLVLGASFMIGGFRYKKQKFKQIVGQVNSGLLMLGAIALILPTILVHSGKDVDVTNDISSSRLCSTVLLINYLLYLYFQLNTHLYAFADDGECTECNSLLRVLRDP